MQSSTEHSDKHTVTSQKPATGKSQKSSIFGDACPREVVLAQRTGKAEKDILAEEAMHEKLHLRLTPRQLAEKQSLEGLIEEIKHSLQTATDLPTQQALTKELERQRLQLDNLTKRFELEAIEKAKAGGGVRPSERMARARSADAEDPFHDDYERGRHGRGHPFGRRMSGPHDMMHHQEGFPFYDDTEDYQRHHAGFGEHQRRH